MTTKDTTPKRQHHALPIGQVLRVIRNNAGLTQTEVARRGGPDFRTISHWETGRKQPSLPLLMRYLSAVGADLRDLQDQFDQLADPELPADRLTAMERRLDALERWRLELTAASIEGNARCETSKETSGGS